LTVPPEKPEVTETTPSSNWNWASTHQKQPAPKVAVSILDDVIGCDELMWFSFFCCAQDLNDSETIAQQSRIRDELFIEVFPKIRAMPESGLKYMSGINKL